MTLDVDAIETAKQQSTLQLLFKAARLVNEQALARLQSASGLTNIRPAHTNLFPHIDFEGTRITVLADRLGISKQAVATLVDELVDAGGLEKVPDPQDGRAKLVRFKPGMILHGLGELRAFEEELAAQIPDGEMVQLNQILTHLLGVVDR